MSTLLLSISKRKTELPSIRSGIFQIFTAIFCLIKDESLFLWSSGIKPDLPPGTFIIVALNLLQKLFIQSYRILHQLFLECRCAARSLSQKTLWAIINNSIDLAEHFNESVVTKLTACFDSSKALIMCSTSTCNLYFSVSVLSDQT